ncbi:TonB-dependent receptor [Steroidobacter cummioxidans]|uniref:TonB-dependent receptor n=1 Tax=Steroidobacter cummioxidans TaxID=1803913 RepID=UPI000E317CAD|nr:TonB-dependent receptor [Steroidobacter cummioxidans]
MRKSLSIGLRCGVTVALPWVALGSQAAEQSADSGVLQEIVVTANKRNESLTEVPSTIALLTGDTLEQRGMQQFSEYIKAVPGLSAIDAAAPGRGQAVIRGVTSGVKQNAPTVVFYLDDLPLTASSPLAVSGTNIFDPQLADVERVEVLKGPQSTLYGASAMGGLIKIVTKQPSFSGFEGSVRTEFGGIEDGGAIYGANASFNLPLSDRVALRLSGYGRHRGGFVDNARYNDKDVNESDSYGVRAALRIQINDVLETSFSSMYQKTEGDAYAYESLDPVTLKPMFGQYRFDLNYNTAFSSEYQTVANTTTYDAGFATITNTLSYSQTDDFFLRDYSNQYYVFIPTAPDGVGIPGRTTTVTERVTNEFRIASKEGEKIEWLAGLFYTREKDRYGAHISANDPVTGAVLPGEIGNVYTFDLFANFEEYAAFGDVTYNFSDQFEVTAGMRYSKNEQDFRAPRSGVISASPLLTGDSSDSANTYLVTASYHPTERSTIYARAASAYRPGSTQPLNNSAAPAEYGPDHLWNYEVGVKGDWLGGTLSPELSIYHIDWSDIQLNSLVNGFSVISNAGKAESEGVEASLTYRPIRGLSIAGAAAYNRAKILTDNPSIGAVAGDTLPFSPKWTGSLSIDYSMPVSAAADALFGVTYAYQGERYTALSGDAINTRYELPDYSTLDLRAGLEWSTYSVSLRIDNVTDERALTSAQRVRVNATQNNPVIGTVLQPRTAMLALGVKF